MIADLKPYFTYKDSGVPWLGEVPEHWEVRRLKASVAQVNEQTSTKKPDDVYVALEHVESWTGRVRLPSGDVAFDSQVKRFRRDDVLFCKLRPYLAKVTRLPVDGVCVGEFFVLRTRKVGVAPEFLEKALRSKLIIDTINSSTFGAKMPRAEWSFVGNLLLGIPPLPEQSAIVRFLDHADRRIRRYIRAKQKLIKLLEEQKQVIIHLAVTRGLDPNVRLKPSGVEWLGEVPEHWEMKRAKYLFREIDRRSTTGAEALLSLRMYSGLVPHNEVSTIPIAPQALIGFKKVEPGQIVMNRMRAAIGMFGIVRQGGLVSPDYAVLEPVADVDPLFFVRLFKTPTAGTVFRVESKGLGTGSSGFMRLYTDRFGMIKLPVPPREEQANIVKGIELGTQEIERTEQRINREVALLREYRTRLIADVVTGKLDVRDAAARLPEELEEPQPLEEADAVTDADEDTADDLEAVPEEAEA